MKKPHIGHLLGGLCLLAFGLTAGMIVKAALAARNSSGTMAASNGPYVSGTTISSSAVNARFADIETEITDSLDRSGKGPMLAPLRLTNGTNAAPSLTFDSDTDTGFYRVGADNPAVTVAGTQRQAWSTTGTTVTGTLGVTGASTFTGAVTANSNTTGASATAGVTMQNADNYQMFLLPRATASAFNGLTQAGDTALIFSQGSVGTGNLVLGQHNAGSVGIRMNGSGTSVVGGLIVGATGTSISASFRGTVSWTPGLLTTGTCATNTITVTGASAGADCIVTPPSTTGITNLSCAVILNTCNLQVCNPTAGNASPPSGTYACRTFQ